MKLSKSTNFYFSKRFDNLENAKDGVKFFFIEKKDNLSFDIFMESEKAIIYNIIDNNRNGYVYNLKIFNNKVTGESFPGYIINI